MPELKITHGGKVHGVAVDRVYKIKRGDEEKALAAMRSDGADNIVFKGDQGDVFIASRVKLPGDVEINDRVEIEKSSRVEFNGVRGVLMGFDDERNQLGERLKAALTWAGVGGGIGLAGFAVGALKLGAALLNPLAALGIVGGGLALGGLIGFIFGKKSPDYDKLDKYAAAPELA